ncbi:Uncharacterized protein APZ42_020732 [Daphnia magna]|uniref:Uncharacterized protein n=1 Tax=Daphnia magna TaxID=35525 RepID=A0A164XCT7_9CRUS|nr:Uncharacterized protein APZ42_020732 [Daphnia magna]
MRSVQPVYYSRFHSFPFCFNFRQCSSTFPVPCHIFLEAQRSVCKFQRETHTQKRERKRDEWHTKNKKDGQ